MLDVTAERARWPGGELSSEIGTAGRQESSTRAFLACILVDETSVDTSILMTG